MHTDWHCAEETPPLDEVDEPPDDVDEDVEEPPDDVLEDVLEEDEPLGPSPFVVVSHAVSARTNASGTVDFMKGRLPC